MGEVISLYESNGLGWSPTAIPCSQCEEPVEMDEAVYLIIRVKYPEREQRRSQNLHLACYQRIFQPLLDAPV